jgi:hypothetical protein
MSDELPIYRPRCRYITSKSMQVYGEDFESDPDYISGNAEFTCECTGTGLGPDGCGVDLEECKNPERSCYQEY